MKGCSRIEPATPAQTLDPISIQSHNRNISFPSSIAPRELIDGELLQVEYFHCQIRDLPDGDVVSCSNIEGLKLGNQRPICNKHGGDNVRNMDVGLALRAVSQYLQAGGVGTQVANKVVSHAMGLSVAQHFRSGRRNP